jgi:hypothetical protein
MKVIVFGATGMVGKGALLEALESPDVEAVLAVGRGPSGVQHPKLRDLVHKDLYEYASLEGELKGYDACFFCLGVSSAGMSETDYTRVTYDLTLAAARTLVRLNPQMTFIYVSGANTDSTEKGSTMWARVKGRTENEAPQARVQGGVHVPARVHPPDEGRDVAHRSVPRRHRHREAALPPLQCAHARLADHDREGRQGDDCGSEAGLQQAADRPEGHQRARSRLTRLWGAGGRQCWTTDRMRSRRARGSLSRPDHHHMHVPPSVMADMSDALPMFELQLSPTGVELFIASMVTWVNVTLLSVPVS